MDCSHIHHNCPYVPVLVSKFKQFVFKCVVSQLDVYGSMESDSTVLRITHILSGYSIVFAIVSNHKSSF